MDVGVWIEQLEGEFLSLSDQVLVFENFLFGYRFEMSRKIDA